MCPERTCSEVARPTRFEPVTSAFGGQGTRHRDCEDASPHSEMSDNLLIGLRSNFRNFSECALINNANHLDFDSAIPRFESWRPSHINALRRRRYLAALLGPFSSFRNSFRSSFRNSVPCAF